MRREEEKGLNQGSSLIDQGEDGAFEYDFELRSDSIISESDLPRIERELNHNAVKTAKQKKRQKKLAKMGGVR